MLNLDGLSLASFEATLPAQDRDAAWPLTLAASDHFSRAFSCLVDAQLLWSALSRAGADQLVARLALAVERISDRDSAAQALLGLEKLQAAAKIFQRSALEAAQAQNTRGGAAKAYLSNS